ncbi:hypothetical protein BDA96_01G053400 [Sorghum bicolor]|uniref:Xylanase inhibitor C-terminal domain-containing protein n=1 Tax=Sorghum bicolor TaxID=4558 RepID=A0A921UXA9_SORBI|nr:hypothetical protein BDA96_01G053400 [Sorghum bicolor]
MAVLCSSSCCSRPLLQGMLLLAVLLLASIQAGPVMAALDAQEVQAFGDMFHKAFDYGGKKLATEVSSRPGMERFGKGLKTGFTVDRRAHGMMDKHQNTGMPYVVDTIATATGLRLKVVTVDITATPVARTGLCGTGTAVAAGGTGTQIIRLLGSSEGEAVLLARPFAGTLQYCAGPQGAVLGLGRGGELSRNLRTFSYVTSTGNTVVWFPQPQVAGTTGASSITLVPSKYPNDGRYYVRMTGIRVGDQQPIVPTSTAFNLGRPPPPPLYLYLSTTQPNTYIESNLYDRLRNAIIQQMGNPWATPTSSSQLTAGKLCYAAAAASSLPRIAILLANNNGDTTMELGLSGAAAWYPEPTTSRFCLGILPATTEEPVLGSMIQSGNIMTIDLMAAGGQGTLTFEAYR